MSRRAHILGHRRSRGAVAVEFGLLLPVLIALMVIVVDLGRMAYHYNILVKAVRESGRYLSTQLPGKDQADRGAGTGSQTTWVVATNMVLDYAADLCSDGRPNCLTAAMVGITDAVNTNESKALLSNVPFGAGQHNMVRVTVTGYQLPSLFLGYVLDVAGLQRFSYPPVSATFVQF